MLYMIKIQMQTQKNGIKGDQSGWEVARFAIGRD